MAYMVGFILFVDCGCWKVVIQLVNYTFSTALGWQPSETWLGMLRTSLITAWNYIFNDGRTISK